MATIDLKITVKHDPKMSVLAQEVSKRVTEYILDKSKELAPGTLSDGIEEGVSIRTGTTIRTTVISTKEHSSHVEWGTGLYGENLPAHYIYPTTKKVMVFDIGGETIFAAKTKGQHPQPFMRGSIYKLRTAIKDIL